MKHLKKALSMLLTILMVVGLIPTAAVSVLAEELRDAVVVQNAYIRVSVDKKNGRFNIRTVEGQPARKNDQNVNLTFTEDDTSFTTFRINGTDYIFGNGYKIDDEGHQIHVESSLSEPVTATDEEGNQTVATTWSVEGVAITQLITVYSAEKQKDAGTVSVRYNVVNTNGSPVQVGSRVLLDVMVGNNDGPAYQNGTTSLNLQTTERTLIRGLKTGEDAYSQSKVDGVAIDENNVNYYNMGAYWVMRDTLDVSNPLATNVYAYGFNNFTDSLNPVDRIVVGHWNHLANSKYDVAVEPNLDFTTDTNDYGTADAAVAYFWEPETISAGVGQSFEVLYGLGQLIDPSHVFAITFPDQVSQLQTDDAKTRYLGDGVFQIIVQAENLATYNMYHSSVTCTLTLDSGLDFVQTKNGAVVYGPDGKPQKTSDGRAQTRSYTKPITAEEIEQRDAEVEATGESNIGKMAPGEMCTFTFTVVATGKAWPTTKQYMVEITSQEMDQAYSELVTDEAYAEDESLKSIYNCTKTDFVFLPSVGTMQQTYSYAFSPDEAFYEDEKLITAGINNIEAYNVGTADEEYENRNFDAYLVGVPDGTRYKVKSEDILLVSTRDGSTGNMRVNYSGGDRVDEEGNVIDPDENGHNESYYTPTLPLGEYCLEVKFDEKAVAGMTHEEAVLLNFTTEQTFACSEEDETRIRTGGYLVITKHYAELTGTAYAVFYAFVSALDQAARQLDPTYIKEDEEVELDGGKKDEKKDDKKDSKFEFKESVYQMQLDSSFVPYYEVSIFDTEEEIEAYREEIGDVEPEETGWEDIEYDSEDDDFHWDPTEEWSQSEVLLIIEGMVKEQDGNIIVDTSTEPAIINGVVTYKGTDLSINDDQGVLYLLGGGMFFSAVNTIVHALGFGNSVLNDRHIFPVKAGSGGNVKIDFDIDTSVSSKDVPFFDSESLPSVSIGSEISNEYAFAFGSVTVNGIGSLSMASSGFTFHYGMWSIDFFDGFEKSLWLQDTKEDDDDDEEEEEEEEKEEEKESAKDQAAKALTVYLIGSLSDQLNPMKTLGQIDVYFNRKSLFAPPKFEIAGFGLELSEFKLSATGAGGDMRVSFGGKVKFIIVEAEIGGVFFDSEGFYGIESELAFELKKKVGLIGQQETEKTKGKATINYFRPGVEGESEYGIEFQGKILTLGVECEVSFKEVDDGRVLPDTIIFYAELPGDGFPLTAGTYLTKAGGGLRNLADSIAGYGFDMPLTIEMGIGLKWGIKPAIFEGEAKLQLKMSGIRIMGKLNFSKKPMLTTALIQAQWIEPWFVALKADVDVMGWKIVVGSAKFYVGQNVELNRTDFEGTVSSAIQVPESIPIIGGMPLRKQSFGVNNDMIWGSMSVGIGPLSFAVGISYRWGGGLGGLSFSVGDSLPDDAAMTYLLYTEEETGEQYLMAIGTNISTLATSAVSDGRQQITYCDLGGGKQIIEFCANTGGIAVSDNGKQHLIPVLSAYSGTEPADAMIQVEYYGDELPALTLENGDKTYTLKKAELTDGVGAGSLSENDLLYVTQERDMDGTTQKLAYITIPYEQLTGENDWTLTSDETVDTALLSIKRTGEMESVTMTPNGNKITGTAVTKYAKAGDTVNFYLTPESAPVTNPDPEKGYDEPADPGVKIATVVLDEASDGNFNHTVSSGEIDLTDCTILGEAGTDLRTLLASGDYYLRAELATSTTSKSKTDTSQKVGLQDPLAPNNESGTVTLAPAGNGYFDVTFPKAEETLHNGGKATDLQYALDFYDENGGLYEYYNGVVLDKSALTDNDDETYTARVGGWTPTQATVDIEVDSRTPNGDGTYTVISGEDTYENVTSIEDIAESTKKSVTYLTGYTGLETGKSYSVKVRPTNVIEMTCHYGAALTSGTVKLPAPKPPVIGITSAEKTGAAYYLNVNAPQPKIQMNVPDGVKVELCSDGEVIKEVENGELVLEDYTTDGTFPLELKATRTDGENKGDTSVTMLYLTIDTIAPHLYIDAPVTGDRTEGGFIAVSGQTAGGGDTVLTAYVDGVKAETATFKVEKDGAFSGKVPVATDKATATLQLVASDKAGNQNSASIKIANGGYKVAENIVVRQLDALRPNANASLETVARYADGKDADGNRLFSESLLESGAVSYVVTKGDAATVSDSGTVTAKQAGSSLIKATYATPDGQTLEAVTVVRVDATGGGSSSGGGSSGGGSSSGGSSGGGSSSGGSSGGGSSSGGSSSGGGTAGGGAAGTVAGETDKLGATINKQPIEIAEVEGGLSLTVDETAVSQSGPIELNIKNEAQSYQINVTEKAVKKLAKEDALIVETPLATVNVPAGAIQSTGATIAVAANGDAERSKAREAVTGGTVLANGAGVTVALDGTLSGAGSGVKATVPVPTSVKLDEFSAVVLVDKDGKTTSVPWKLNMVGDKACVDVAVTGEGSLVFAAYGQSFDDVPAESWASKAIDTAASKGIISGVGGGKYGYGEDVTRAAFATILLRTSGLMTQEADVKLSEVDETDWSYTPLTISKSLGLLTGYEDGLLHGENTVIRVEAMAQVGKALKLFGVSEELSDEETDALLADFSDYDSLPQWARANVAVCVKYGIIAGSDGSLAYEESLTREQAAAIGNRLDDVLVKHLLG